jgi:hypothetical protein
VRKYSNFPTVASLIRGEISRRASFALVVAAPIAAASMFGACLRAMKRLLLAPFLSAPPNPPTGLRVTPRSHALEVAWDPAPRTSSYNADHFEVEMTPNAPALRELLGSAFGAYVQFYSGADPRCVVDALRPEQSFAIRVRCVNRAGASAWVAADASTCQVPRRCGGVGPDWSYVWDQTPTHVEIRVPCPDALRVRPKDVRVRVKPRRVAIAFGPPGAAEVDVLAGALAGEVLCQDDGDFEWELRDVPADDRPGEESSAGVAAKGWDAASVARELFVTLEKRPPADGVVRYDPAEQWDRLLDEDGHARIDRTNLRWFRDEQWRPPVDATCREEVEKALPGMNFSNANQTLAPGRDGELDGWGDKWAKNKKAKKKT